MNTKDTNLWFGLSWLAFIGGIVTCSIGIYNLGMPLSVQGLFVQSMVVIIITSLNLQKTLTDKSDGVPSVTSQWVLITWLAFLVAVGTFAISIYNLDAPLSVQGFYVQSLFLIVITSINLQKVTMEKEKAMALQPINLEKTDYPHDDTENEED